MCLITRQVTSIVESKVEVEAELRKYKLYVTELGKVISLLLNVSGRLARAENAVMSLADDASAQEKVTIPPFLRVAKASTTSLKL